MLMPPQTPSVTSGTAPSPQSARNATVLFHFDVVISHL